MVISVSGMIGSGKSTLSKLLNKKYKNSVLLEEFSENDEIFNKYLEWIYSQKPNIDLSFQAYITESLENSFNIANKKFLNKNSHKDTHIFLDRFNIEHIIFAIVTLSKKESRYLKAFLEMSEHLINLDNNPDLAIFLDINFKNVENRILKRGRKVEIDNFNKNFEYFFELHSIYKKEFINLTTKYKIPYVIIDTNELSEDEVFDKSINIIENFDFSKSRRN
ncbi:deoxynucleoside kinase [Mycoplasma sp. CSL10137]|uniref:deoxynucleoside kinase n=1 Tax=unclassified Mycoplasma TaxID=2683645 RepID=UPI00197BBB11|nr:MULTISPECIES: deoxynucleoside kinase [unclassified Mycoplasma]MBN4083505.1 deoxynucleoside kinase [Mycoplasma sp. CSL10137]MBU4693042.1 deoxynucleoside kinase [Mycoplasma sp. CSL7491-lung]